MPFDKSSNSTRPVTVQAPTNAGDVASTPLPVNEAIAVANQPVKVLAAKAPTVGNLPANAQPGQMYQFQANPSVVYIYGSDNIWRALIAVPVT